jgi:radical SAM superfamily enzyme YgiQ (UPF0313 family)
MAYVAQAAFNAGHEVKTIDLCFSGKDVRKPLGKAISEFEPEVVGLSVRNLDNVNLLCPISYLPDAARVAAMVRERSSAKLVVGGSAVGLAPESMLRTLRGDYVVIADGEVAFVKMLEALEKGNPCDRIPGVGFINDQGAFHLTPPERIEFGGIVPDLGRWIDVAPYIRIGASYNVQSRRGCNQSCIYCSYNQNLEGNRLRFRDPKEVVDEIEEAIKKYNPDTFEFVDSVFNDPSSHASQILEEIIRRPWKTRFTAMGVSPKGLDAEFLDLMWRAGFRSFMITPEAASSEMISNYSKGFTLDDVRKAAQAINRTDFDAWWFFMIGGPGETNETLGESLDFAVNNLRQNGRGGNHVAHFFLGVRIYPDTALWEIARDQGYVTSQTDALSPQWYLSRDLDLERCVEQLLHAASICPEIYLGFDEKVLVFSKTAAWIFNLLGFPKPYWRYFRTANSFGLKTRIRFMFRPDNMAMMIRESLNKQGFKDNE